MSNIVTRNWRDLIRPRGIHIEQETLTDFYGRFSCEPLERGYGITLANSLRRVLLSSLQGAAITTVRIEGALHEFTTIEGVVEDVTDIILNIKALRLRMDDSTPRTLTIDKQGEGEVKASDIQCPTGVSVLDPGQHIATLSKGGHLRMERVRRGEDNHIQPVAQKLLKIGIRRGMQARRHPLGGFRHNVTDRHNLPGL